MNIHLVRRTTAVLLTLLVCAALVMFATAKTVKDPTTMNTASSIYEFTMNDIDGKSIKLEME